ncbi:hypothetical protein B0A52_09128 [Exophiala mesophila]|uniref:NAD-dependent epimerase/dehydratase domain-containing protein n=1 Tax=Exophiala mesophila TaxID=212818 RepID=A0A438MUD7_EXOME|nr:hypothetical protein B0A52_09128 [Exophiala mesophila]
MAHRILITGASGYLGGTLLAKLPSANLPAYDKLFALVRTPVQAEAVQQYGVQPLTFAADDEEAVRENIVKHGITIVFYLINAVKLEGPLNFIKALAEVKIQQGGREVHFLHTTGAKLFSSHAGAPTDRPLLDTDNHLYDIQKSQKAPHAVMQSGVTTNNAITEQGEKCGVRTYIFAPCIVYGKNQGFGNPISIQTVAIVKAAKATGRVFSVDHGRPTWPVCHVADNASLYLQILHCILAGQDPGHGKNGYYLASPGSVAWDDIYLAMAKRLTERKVINTDQVVMADDAALEKMAEALGCSKEFVAVQIGGKCTFTAEHGVSIGWKPQYPASHILEAAAAEVDLILQSLP